LGRRVTVEVKSVNHRYLDLKLHLPRELAVLESKLTELCRTHVSRGRVDVYVALEPGTGPVGVKVNRPLAQGMVRALRELKEAFALAGEPDLALLASMNDVIIVENAGPLGEDSWPALAALAASVFQSLLVMRAREGASLARDLEARLDAVSTRFEDLVREAGNVLPLYRDKLARRMKELLGESAGVDPERLAQEAALLADRADITEEVVRARSHLEQFRAALGQDGPKGRKLDFLIQELFREVNTASNKAQSARASGAAVEIKTELEKMREQVQNLE